MISLPTLKSVKIKINKKEFEAQVRRWNKKDIPIIRKALRNWRDLSEFLKKHGARGTNLPELLSEAIFCICSGSVQVVNVKGRAEKGFDCYDQKKHARQQIKGSSNIATPSSFGPHSKFDEVYWVVIEPESKHFKYKIYSIPRDAVVNHPNFRKHVPEGRRPRFSLWEIVKRRNLQPVYEGKI